MRNLIFSDKHQAIVTQMHERLFDMLEQTGGMNMPPQRDRGGLSNKRNPAKGKVAEFPKEFDGKPKSN